MDRPQLELIASNSPRPELTPDERDDARQVLTLAIASIQRERAAADQNFLRGRNLWAIAAGLFTAVQAAFLANIGRTSAGKVLLGHQERDTIAVAGIISAICLVVSLTLLVCWLDRPRRENFVGADTLESAWIDPRNENQDRAVLDVLAARAIQEERAWANSNRSRRKALKWLAVACALTAAATVTELVLLYTPLA